MDVIKVEKLDFSYGNRQILKEIDLGIKSKKLTGILGPNGCGKSTLLKNILGYLKNDSGNIKILNKDSKNYTQKEKAKCISLVPQKSQLMSAMDVEDFVLMGRLPHLQNSWDGYSQRDKETAHRYICQLELESFIKRKAVTLSGGEFQRVLLARALAQETEIILLDEPTSALDLNHAIDLMEKVKDAIIKKGITAVAVLHDLNLAAMFCDEIVMMKNGEIYCKGSPKETFTAANLKEIYELECSIFYTENDIPYIIPRSKGGNK